MDGEKSGRDMSFPCNWMIREIVDHEKNVLKIKGRKEENK